MRYDFLKLSEKLKIFNWAEALAAALFSLLMSGGSLWLLRGVLYGKWPVYDELVAGGSIWEGYNKQGDLTLFYLLYLLIPFFFCVFLYIRHTLVNIQGYARNGLEISEEKKKDRKEWKTCGMILIAAFLGIESVRALETAAAGAIPGRRDMLYGISVILSVALFVTACGVMIWLKVSGRDGKKLAERLLRFSQICLPFQFLGYYRFYYRYESEEGLIQLFYSAKWKWFCIALFLLFLFCQLRCVWKRKNGIYLSSLMMLAAGSVAATPEGILSVDFFHNGEMAFPMQQLLSYGKIPYFDVDPIHGLCDYFYSLVNAVFFNGSYFAQNAAIQAAGILMAILLALVMGICIQNRYAALGMIYLTMPFLVQKAGVRYLLFFIAFFLLLSDRVRKDSRTFLWWWVLLCIMGISWNVSIGSSMAVAFLPEILLRMVKDVIPKCRTFSKWEKKEKRQFVMAYGVLFVMGIAYIPWFLQILRFLGENAGTTLYVNGTPVFGDEFHPVETFAFLLPYLIALIYALKGSKKGKSLFVSMFTCLLVISNYACVRYDEGARLAVLALFFIVVYMGLVSADNNISKNMQWGAMVLCIGMGIYLMRGYWPDLGEPMAAETVPASVEVEIMGKKTEDPIVYVSGESVNMPALGTGFIQGSTLNSLKNIQTVFDAELQDESYLDLTNKISHYVIFDKESVLPFTSAYNISNQKMQEKAIALIEEERPHLILITPLIQFDLAPVSLRSMDFYTALIRMGYQPYVYGDVVYLLDGDTLLPEAADGERSLGLVCHKEYLGMLPYIWGSSAETNPSVLGEEREQFHLEKTQISEKEDGSVEVAAGDLAEWNRIDFIEIVVSRDAVEDGQLRMTFLSDVDSEEHSFVFENGSEKQEKTKETMTYLIPVGSSPFWNFSEGNDFVMEGIHAEGIIDMMLIASGE